MSMKSQAFGSPEYREMCARMCKEERMNLHCHTFTHTFTITTNSLTLAKYLNTHIPNDYECIAFENCGLGVHVGWLVGILNGERLTQKSSGGFLLYLLKDVSSGCVYVSCSYRKRGGGVVTNY